MKNDAIMATPEQVTETESLIRMFVALSEPFSVDLEGDVVSYDKNVLYGVLEALEQILDNRLEMEIENEEIRN